MIQSAAARLSRTEHQLARSHVAWALSVYRRTLMRLCSLIGDRCLDDGETEFAPCQWYLMTRLVFLGCANRFYDHATLKGGIDPGVEVSRRRAYRTDTISDA